MSAGAGWRIWRNVEFHHASADAIPLPDGSQDFGYSLGVLHHIPDTARAMADAVRKLKPGAPFLVYLYYDFENRPAWFRGLWKAQRTRPGTYLPVALSVAQGGNDGHRGDRLLAA